MTRSTLTKMAAVALAFVLGVAAPARSQPADQPSDSLWNGTRTDRLTTVFVRNTDGRTTTGKLLAFSPDALVLVVDGEERRIARASILRVQTRDSLKNGAIIGAVTGLLLGSLTAGIADCTSSSGVNGCPGLRFSFLAFSVATYTGLGAGIDALIPGRTTIYAAPPASPVAALRQRTHDVSLTLGRLSW
jgi:hypothetical protein